MLLNKNKNKFIDNIENEDHKAWSSFLHKDNVKISDIIFA